MKNVLRHSAKRYVNLSYWYGKGQLALLTAQHRTSHSTSGKSHNRWGAGPMPHYESPWLLAGRADPHRGSCLNVETSQSNQRPGVRAASQQLQGLGAQSLDGTHAGGAASCAGAVPSGIILNKGSPWQELGGASSYLEPAQGWLHNLPLESVALRIGRGHFYLHNLKILISTHTITWKSQSLSSRSWYRVWV